MESKSETKENKVITIKFSYIIVIILIIAILIGTIIFLLFKGPNPITGVVSEKQTTNTTIKKETNKNVDDESIKKETNKNVDDESIKKEQRKQMAEAYAQSVLGDDYKCKYVGYATYSNNTYVYTIDVYRKENTRVTVGWFSVEIVNDVVKPSASHFHSSSY